MDVREEALMESVALANAQEWVSEPHEYDACGLMDVSLDAIRRYREAQAKDDQPTPVCEKCQKEFTADCEACQESNVLSRIWEIESCSHLAVDERMVAIAEVVESWRLYGYAVTSKRIGADEL